GEGSELRPREILREPPGVLHAIHDFGRAARRELGVRGNIGRAGYLVLVPEHENAVSRRNDVGLHRVRAELECELVGGSRVLWSIPAGTPVTDYEGPSSALHPTSIPLC